MNDAISMLKLTVITALGVIAAYFNVLLIPSVERGSRRRLKGPDYRRGV